MLYKKEWWPNYTEDDTTKFNVLRLENWEEGGEIHFITKKANEYNEVEIGACAEKKQFYNTKIGSDGRLNDTLTDEEQAELQQGFLD